MGQRDWWGFPEMVVGMDGVEELLAMGRMLDLRPSCWVKDGWAEIAAGAREYNQALLVVERNNHGAGVLAYLEATERYRHVYTQRGQAGWLTSVVTRPEMVACVGAMLSERPEVFASERLLAECRTFVSGKDGSAGAASGSHDDLVMAMGMGWMVRGEGRVG